MTKSFFYLTLGFFFIITSCRKGDEDPFLSLSTRKARITGEWEMTSLVYNEARFLDGEQNGTVASAEGNADMITIIEIINGTDTTIFQQDIIDYTIRIDKDGTWEKRMQYQTGSTSLYDTAEEIDSIVYSNIVLDVESGTWAFTHKTKGTYKNKERVNLSLIEKTYVILESYQTQYYASGDVFKVSTPLELIENKKTYAPGENNIIYDIIMLKSKEMKWQREYFTDDSVEDENGINYWNLTEELNEYITWKAK